MDLIDHHNTTTESDQICREYSTHFVKSTDQKHNSHNNITPGLDYYIPEPEYYNSDTRPKQYKTYQNLNVYLDSIDLTESPEKNTNTQRDKEKINEDTSDDDIDKMIEFNKDKARTIYRKDTNDQRKWAKIIKSKKGRTTKVYAINIERDY